MSWENVLKKLTDGVVAVAGHVSFRALIVMGREEAQRVIAARVQQLPAEQLDAYEVEFLRHAASLYGQQERIRAMELYAYLKLAETGHYGKFRGFAFQGGPLE